MTAVTIYQNRSDKKSKHTYRAIPYKEGRLAATREKRDADKLRKESDTKDLLFDSLLFQIITRRSLISCPRLVLILGGFG